MNRWIAVAAVLGLVGLITGCSTGAGAVAQGGSFEFVAPGGQVDIYYDPPENRSRPGPISGPDLLDVNRTVSLSDFAGKVVVINVCVARHDDGTGLSWV